MAEARVSLLDRDGQTTPLNAQSLLALPQGSDADVRFFSWTSLSGLELRLSEAEELTSLRLVFLGCGETDVWNSWLRAPRLPTPGMLRLALDGQPVETTEHRFCVAARPIAPPQLHHDAVLVELRFPPRRASLLSLRLPPGPYALLRLRRGAQPYVGLPFPPAPAPDLAGYPRSRADLDKVGDRLAAELAGAEPTLDRIWQVALPFRGGAFHGTIGAPHIVAPVAVEVNPSPKP